MAEDVDIKLKEVGSCGCRAFKSSLLPPKFVGMSAEFT